MYSQGMVFAVNCGADGSPNSFTDFKNAALAIGAQLQAEASSSAAPGYGAPPTSTTASVASTAPSSVASAAAATHTIVVGGSNLTFSPEEVTAQPNDVVVFEFHAKNHTVTQSSFAAPCEKLALTSTSGQVGFDSGL